MTASQLLDQAHSLARLEALAAAPEAYAAQLAHELGPATSLAELEARDAQLRVALAAIAALVERAARLHLDHALADDRSIAAPTRKVFASTVASYAGRLDVLEARARDVAARGGSPSPTSVAARVTECAQAALALGDALRAGAATAAPLADRLARDRTLDDATRRRWSAARRDLETLAARPEAIAAAPFADRLAAWPDQLDEPAPEPEVTFADMIELD